MNKNNRKYALWVMVERTEHPALFKLSIKKGTKNFMKPRVVTALQIVATLAKWLADMAADAA